MEKNRTGIMIIGIILILGVYFVRRYGFNFNYDFDEDIVLVDSYVINDELNELSLQLYNADLVIKESTDERLLVEYYTNQEENGHIEFIDNVIQIDGEDINDLCVGICNIIRRMVIYIPETYTGGYDIISVSGDIKSEIDLHDVNIETTSGDVFLINIDSANIGTTSGDIKLGKVDRNISIRTTSGDVHIDTLANRNDSNIRTVSGDVHIGKNENDCYVDAKTTSGDIKIKNNNRESNIVLNIDTTSGDIYVG